MLLQPFFGLVNWDGVAATHWGETNQPIGFTTTTDDTARVVATAAIAEAPVDGPLRFAGATRKPADLAAIASSVTGHPFAMRRLGVHLFDALGG
jgi:hypothetical protein